jgi:hypothetical protein
MRKRPKKRKDIAVHLKSAADAPPGDGFEAQGNRSPDPGFEHELLRGICDALTGNVISERESLAALGVEPEGEDDEHDFDWTPSRDRKLN